MTDPERIRLAKIGKRIGLKALKSHCLHRQTGNHFQMVPGAGSQKIRWFKKSHKDVLAACDFFTTEVITPAGLVTCYVLFFIHIGTRKIHIAGITPHPDESWMKQMARGVSMADFGFLSGCRYLLHDRDSKFCHSFQKILQSVGIKPIRLPPRSPNLNAFAERWVRSVKEECLSKLVLFGRQGLEHALREYHRPA